jgi:PIN domain nuclease of toxin-antitoxin system
VKLLLDTHVIIWWQQDNPRLGQRARALLADPANEVMVSTASFWEMTIKHRKGKLPVAGEAAWAEAVDDGFVILNLEPAHLDAVAALPTVDDHNDPFDHLLLAQAVAEGMLLVTADRHMTAYGVPCIGVR